MSENLKEVARRKLLEAKRKAKEEKRKAAEALKAKIASKKAEQKEKEERERQYQREKENERKSFAKRIYEEILIPHYKSKKDAIVDKDFYLAKMEDGNIYGKKGDEYFCSYQKDNKTYMKVFKDTGVKKVNDGDHYPTFADANTYEVKTVALTPFGRLNPETVRTNEALSFSFYGEEEEKEYNIAHEIRERVDEDLKKLQNTVKR